MGDLPDLRRPSYLANDETPRSIPGVDGHTTLESSRVDGLKPCAMPRLELVDRFIDEPRELRVAVIGAGISGIIAGILLPAKVPGIKLTIFEKNADVVCMLIMLLL